MERTLILAKPDAYARDLTGEILARFERKGLAPVALRVHDDDPRGRPSAITPSTSRSRSSASSRVHHLRPARRDGARGAVGDHRRAPGDRRDQPARGVAGSIRGDLAIVTGENLVHGSDGPESAAREIGIFFPLVTRRRAS